MLETLLYGEVIEMICLEWCLQFVGMVDTQASSDIDKS